MFSTVVLISARPCTRTEDNQHDHANICMPVHNHERQLAQSCSNMRDHASHQEGSLRREFDLGVEVSFTSIPYNASRSKELEIEGEFVEAILNRTITHHKTDAKDAEDYYAPHSQQETIGQRKTNMCLGVDRSCQRRSRLRRHPFVDEIIDTLPPTKWKILTLDKYDGTIDPSEHINAYVTPYDLNATSRPYHLTLIALVNIRQEEDESLHSFMERFAIVSIKIRDLSPKVALHSMVMALNSGLFSNSLCKKVPASMDKLRAKTSKYIQKEEMTEF
ncbi:hypothetical protein CR513_37061, partial [Mucuna pruriens]